MDALEDSTTSIVMTGNLVDTTGISNTLTTDQISSIGDTAALDTVTVTTEGSNISIGAFPRKTTRHRWTADSMSPPLIWAVRIRYP